MKAIGLIRVSTAVQQLESQSLKVKEAILRDGYLESDVILIEDKESGSKLSEEERSGLNKLKTIINDKSNEVDAVYCYELSRISRKAGVVYSIRDYLIKHSINLICLNPYFRMLKEDGSFDEASNLAFGIFSTLAENETYIRTARIMRGKERKKNEGKLSCGRPLFGYSIDNNHYIIPHPKNSLIIQEIFTRYSNLESSSSIGRDLYYRNALGNENSKMINVQTYTAQILKEKRYARIDESSIYPPLISKELFYKCQNILNNKPDYFIRKSKTIGIYPLQGYIFTTDGYMMSPSISNNRYLKMNGGGVKRISLNMKVADELTKKVMIEYLSRGKYLIDNELRRKEINNNLILNNTKLSGIDIKIKSLIEENDRINARVIKGRLSESKGDAMIDSNILEINKLEDLKVELNYQNNLLNNELIFISNNLLSENEEISIKNNDELKNLVIKYLKKVVVEKIGFSRYCLTYYFLDGSRMSGCFYSVNHHVEFYNIK